MDRSEKDKEIEALNAEFKAAKNLFVAGFQGLTVSQDSELRRSIRAAGSEVSGGQEYAGTASVQRYLG